MSFGSLRADGPNDSNGIQFTPSVRKYRQRTQHIQETLSQVSHSQQTDLVVVGLLNEMRVSFAAVILHMNQRSGAAPDAVVRYHLTSITNEVVEMGRQFGARFTKLLETHDIAAVIDNEMKYFKSSFPDRIRYERSRSGWHDVVPSWVSIQLFRLLVHDLIEEILRGSVRSTFLSVWLSHQSKALVLYLNNLTPDNMAELRQHFVHEKFCLRLNALRGSVEIGERSIAIRIPIISRCRQK